MKNRFLRASIIVSLSCCALLTGCGLKSGLYMPAPAHRPPSAAGSAQNPQARQTPGAAARDQTSSDEHAASGAAAENK